MPKSPENILNKKINRRDFIKLGGIVSLGGLLAACRPGIIEADSKPGYLDKDQPPTMPAKTATVEPSPTASNTPEPTPTATQTPEPTPTATEVPVEIEPILEGRPTSPEEVFDFSPFREVLNDTTSDGKLEFFMAVNDRQTRPNGELYFPLQVKPEYWVDQLDEEGNPVLDEEGNPVQEVNNQVLADLLRKWGVRIQRDTNEFGSDNRRGLKPEVLTLTVVNGNLLKEEIDKRVERPGRDNLVNNIGIIEQVEASFGSHDENGEPLLNSQGEPIRTIDRMVLLVSGAESTVAGPEANIPLEYRRIPIITDSDTETGDSQEDLEWTTNHLVNAGQTDAYLLSSPFLFEDSDGKLTLICVNQVSRYSQRIDHELQHMVEIHDYLLDLLYSQYASSLHPEHVKRVTGHLLGGTSVASGTFRESVASEILMNELVPHYTDEEDRLLPEGKIIRPGFIDTPEE